MAAVVFLVVPASGETFISKTSTSVLYALDAAGSPYVLSQDFSVLPGGTLFVGPGAELQFQNGAVLRGAGGDIRIQGTSLDPAVVRARPGAVAPAWGGINLTGGSQLALRSAVLHNASPMISAHEGSSVTVDGAAIDGCGSWCLRVFGEADIALANASFADGRWGYYDGGSTGAQATNLSFVNFTAAALRFTSPASFASLKDIRVSASLAGLVADGLSGSTLEGLDVEASSGAAVAGSMSVDLRILNSTLRSQSGVALDLDAPVRLRLEGTTVEGSAGAVRLLQASAPSLVANHLSSSSGACLELPGASGALLVANALEDCARSLSVPRGTAPPNATAGPSNTVNGKPFLWVEGGSDLAFGANETTDWGLVVLFGVDGARLTDITLVGAGIYLFGCTDITVERLHVSSADVGITAVGSSGVHVVAYRAQDVGRALDAWSDAAFPSPSADFLIERARVERAFDTGFMFASGQNLTLRWSLVVDAGVAVRFDGVAGALVANLIVQSAGTGVWISNSTGVFVVDSAIEESETLGLLAQSSTGRAARNAFINNAQHASAPSSPQFEFNELLAGNYWDNWSAPDADGDGWADIPYNLTDGTGVDQRPRLVRWDFHPTALVAGAPVVELGEPTAFDATPSFDDFSIAEVYWQVRFPNDNATARGFHFLWTPNVTGLHTVTASVVGSFGATDDYAFPVMVVDSVSPSFVFGPVGRAEAGADLAVLVEATDNDPRFPVGAFIEWTIVDPTAQVRTGNTTALEFEVPVGAVGLHTLTVTLFDAAGNGQTGSLVIDVGDTTPPEIQIAYDGQPDLGLPFVMDAAATFDASGVDPDSASWTWVEAGTQREVVTFPVAEVTFGHAGNHTVTLRLCDGLGNCGQAQVVLVARDTHGPRLVRIHVVVPGRDAVDITPANPAIVTARAGEEVVFEIFAEDPSGEASFQWDFGDGTTGEGARVVHRFGSTGEVSVVVTMVDPLGNSNLSAVRMRIEPGGGFFGEIIPGVQGDFLVLALAVGGAAGVAYLYVRRRPGPDDDDKGDEL
jgi:nitrous oxidase accessory protein NosD